MLVPPLCYFGLLLALRCSESLFLGICLSLFIPEDRLFIGSKDLYRPLRYSKWLFCTFRKNTSIPSPHISTGQIILPPRHPATAPCVLPLCPLVTASLYAVRLSTIPLKLFNVNKAF